jgi:hypothetical protein
MEEALLNATSTLPPSTDGSALGLTASFTALFAALWALAADAFVQLTGSHHVADLIKYVFLGSIIETGRSMGTRLMEGAKRSEHFPFCAILQ